MAYLVIACGVLLSVFGAYAMVVGNSVIQVERGWSSFIAGAALFSSGIVTIALGLVIRTLVDLKGSLSQALVGAPVMADRREPSPLRRSLPDRAATDVLAGSAAATWMQAEGSQRGAVAEPHRLPGDADGYAEQAEPPYAEAEADPSLSREALHPPPHSSEDYQSATGSVNAHFEPDHVHGAGGESGPDAQSADHHARDGYSFGTADPLTRPHAFQDMEEASGGGHADPLSATRSPTQAETSAAALASSSAYGESTTAEDWLDRLDRELGAVPTVDPPYLPPPTSPEPEHEPFAPADDDRSAHDTAGSVPAEAHDRVETDAEPAAAGDPVFERVDRQDHWQDQPALHDRESELAEAAQEDTHRPSPAEAAVIGRYESEGTSYVMYADGSIEAQSAAGIYRFKSMAELKSFIES